MDPEVFDCSSSSEIQDECALSFEVFPLGGRRSRCVAFRMHAYMCARIELFRE